MFVCICHMRTSRKYPDREQCIKTTKWLNNLLDNCSTHDVLLSIQSHESDIMRAMCMTIIMERDETLEDVEIHNFITEIILFITTTFAIVVLAWCGLVALLYYMFTVLCISYTLFCSEARRTRTEEIKHELFVNILSSSVDILLDFYVLTRTRLQIPDVGERISILQHREHKFTNHDFITNNIINTIILRALSKMHWHEQYRMLTMDRIDIFIAMWTYLSQSSSSLYENQVALLFAVACRVRQITDHEASGNDFVFQNHTI